MLRPGILALSLCAVAACDAAPPGAPAKTATASRADIERVVGEGWTGTLVYRDYSPPFGDVELKVEADIASAPEGLALAIRYPDEPQANTVEVLELSEDGARLGGELVVERSEADGMVAITTRANCEDDEKPAECEHRYVFGQKVFEMDKRVRFDDKEDFIRRNFYRLNR